MYICNQTEILPVHTKDWEYCVFTCQYPQTLQIDAILARHVLDVYEFINRKEMDMDLTFMNHKSLDKFEIVYLKELMENTKLRVFPGLTPDIIGQQIDDFNPFVIFNEKDAEKFLYR